jgi:hypothetical protein
MPRKKKDEDSTVDPQPIESGVPPTVSDSLDTPPSEPADEPALPTDPTEDQPAAAPPLKPAVPMDVYVTICGVKADQMAGFVNWAKRTKKGPKLTVEEWRAVHQEFKDRPVR